MTSEQIKLIAHAKSVLDLWYEPWGAGKAERWAVLTGQMPFNPNLLLEYLRDVVDKIDALERVVRPRTAGSLRIVEGGRAE